MEATRMMELIHTADSVTHLLAALRAEGANKVQLSSAMKSYLSLKAREKAVPISGQFELTPLCNLDCKMCYVHLNRDQMQGQPLLPAETWENLMQQAIDQGMMYATLTGGECLTYPDFDRLYLFLHNAGVHISVLTNGVLLNEKRIRFFQAHPPAFMQVTLYGSDNDVYEKVTGHRMFDTVMRNIRMADEAELPIVLNVTPNKYSEGDHEKLIKLVASTGLRFEINSSLMKPHEDTGRADASHEITYTEYFRLIKLKIQLTGNVVPDECLKDLPAPNKADGVAPVGLRCGAGKSDFSIDWKGNLLPCSALYLISQNAVEMGFGKAWETIHKAVMSYSLPVECETCAYKNVANTCAAEHLFATKPGHIDKRMCDWCRERVRSGLAKLD